MDVRLSTEQQALRAAAVRLVADLGPRTVADLDDAERSAKLDAALVATGWRELRSAKDDGAPWASGVEVAAVAEALGRGLADTAFLGPTLAAELRRLAGVAAATERETVLLSADLGELAIIDEEGRIPAGATAVDAGATSALLLSPIGDGWSLAGVTIDEPLVHVDLTRPIAQPVGDSMATELAGQTNTIGPDDLTGLTALALAVTCADLVGAMHGAVDRASEYAKERRQYGRPIAAFQAVQHLLADALVSTEGSRSLTLHASWAVDALSPDEAAAAGAVAKAYTARAARSVCETAIQVHGGIGNTWECLAHVYLRRALLSSDVFGGTDTSLARVLDDRLGIG